MQIQHVRPAVVPSRLGAEVLATLGDDQRMPGFILDARALADQHAPFSAAIARLGGGSYSGAPCIVVPPAETASLFSHEKELDLLRSVAGLIAGSVHPHLKTGIDAVWLVYRAAGLREAWMKPDRNLGACLFKLAGLGLGVAAVTGQVYPEMKLGDPWANGLNFIVKAGGAAWEGKTLPVNELVLSTDKRLEIPLKLMKAVGLSLDPAPSLPDLRPLPPRPRIVPLARERKAAGG